MRDFYFTDDKKCATITH